MKMYTLQIVLITIMVLSGITLSLSCAVTIPKDVTSHMILADKEFFYLTSGKQYTEQQVAAKKLRYLAARERIKSSNAGKEAIEQLKTLTDIILEKSDDKPGSKTIPTESNADTPGASDSKVSQ